MKDDPTKTRHIRTSRLHTPAWCPHCIAKLDAATSIHGARPTPGDYTFCLYCFAALRFDDLLQLRPLTPGEQAMFGDAPPDSTIGEVKRLVDAFRRKHSPR